MKASPDIGTVTLTVGTGRNGGAGSGKGSCLLSEAAGARTGPRRRGPFGGAWSALRGATLAGRGKSQQVTGAGCNYGQRLTV